MGRLLCYCGFIIDDITDNDAEHHLGYILPYRVVSEGLDTVIPAIVDYIIHIEQGKRKEWLQQRYPDQTNLQNMVTHEDIVSEIYSNHFKPFVLCYECEKCGRLWIQHPQYPSRFWSFKPEPPEGIAMPQSFFRFPDEIPKNPL